MIESSLNDLSYSVHLPLSYREGVFFPLTNIVPLPLSGQNASVLVAALGF